MRIQCKVFTATAGLDMEKQINAWLATQHPDVKIDHAAQSRGFTTDAVLLTVFYEAPAMDAKG